MNEPHSLKLSFCVHLIGIPGPQRRPKVRMLLVAAAGVHAVYEGQGTLSKCARWIERLRCKDTPKLDLTMTKKDFGRDQYATLELRTSVLDIESLGFQRVDR
jgi:hypothetical protein